MTPEQDTQITECHAALSERISLLRQSGYAEGAIQGALARLNHEREWAEEMAVFRRSVDVQEIAEDLG